jgi:hypothetical protein
MPKMLADRSSPFPLRRKEKELLPLRLRTGALDDRRETIDPQDDRYGLVASAHREQDSWSDEQHRDFWHRHLSIWRPRRGNRTNREALGFVLALARSMGISYETMIVAMPGRSRNDLRDREILDKADQMYGVLTDPLGVDEGNPRFDGPGMSVAERFAGPTHPDLIAARRCRLPRVWAEDGRGEGEAALPAPLAGWINLDLHGARGPFEGSFAPVGKASRAALREFCAALNHLLEEQPPTGHEQAEPRASARPA